VLGVKDEVFVRMRYSAPPPPFDAPDPLLPAPPPPITSMLFVFVHSAGTDHDWTEPVVVMTFWQVAPTTVQPPGQAARVAQAESAQKRGARR